MLDPEPAIGRLAVFYYFITHAVSEIGIQVIKYTISLLKFSMADTYSGF